MAIAKSGNDAAAAPDPGQRFSASTIAAEAVARVGELTSKTTLGVTSVEPIEDGWLVEVEVLEDRRVPSTADMLAIYEVELGFDGTLLAYRRTRRYGRGKPIGGSS
ncbi:MAG TPA: gas vesicle protein GvpO [Amycolatopsis sp.]|jgi:hypothetical protein|nr:gas vesicle protein GvpO [Amycolatopsis sp.]